jgi:formate--tetrahydrofolate ligase
MKTDIEIARAVELKPIQKIAEKIGIEEEHLHTYGKYIAKTDLSLLKSDKPKGKLLLVSAISPTLAGNGKTVTTVSVALGLNRIGKSCVVALREPSLGPVFGMKGGAAGGGYAQVLPMEDINLHFTGDFHAITSAHNTLAALLDNYQFQNQHSEQALKEIVWRRVLDVNDRSLRFVVTGLGGRTNGLPSENGFDITPASEIMAILCLAESLEDLRTRLDNIILGYKQNDDAFTVKDLGAGGALTLLLKDAIRPNLVQTTEQTPAFIHGGPFANIAHGCNSVLASKMALEHAEYAVTEAGFGADLGAEKFLNIKCRQSGLAPVLTVLVVTLKALRTHGGIPDSEAGTPNPQALIAGMVNLERHLNNLTSFGQSVVVSLNKFASDTEAEIQLLSDWCKSRNQPFAINEAFVKGGAGAEQLARVIDQVATENPSGPIQFTYELEADPEQKVEAIAKKLYKAGAVEWSAKAQSALRKLRKSGKTHYPVCIAKTQYSFSDNPKSYGAPEGHVLHVRDVILNAGAGFIVCVAGDIMRMPGLPKQPAALGMDLKDGVITGLS